MPQGKLTWSNVCEGLPADSQLRRQDGLPVFLCPGDNVYPRLVSTAPGLFEITSSGDGGVTQHISYSWDLINVSLGKLHLSP